MAVECSSVSTGKTPKSIINNNKSVSREAFMLRWLIWISVTAVASIFIRLLMPRDIDSLSRLALVLTSSVGCCAALGASIHCFVTFIINLRVQRLVEAVAFSSLCGGIGLQTITDFTAISPAVNDYAAGFAWLISSLLFFCAAHVDNKLRRGGALQTSVQTILGAVLAFAIPIAILPYMLNVLFLHVIGDSPNTAFTLYMIDKTFTVVSILLILGALAGYYRRVQPAHHMAKLMCYYLPICGFGLICDFLSEYRFDQWWLLGHILLLNAWFILVGKFAMQNAYAHKDAIDRLDEVEALHQISWSLVGAVSAIELLNLFVQSLNSRLQSKYVVVYLVNDDDETLQVAAACGSDEYMSTIGTKYKLKSENRFPGFHSGHTARAFSTGETQVVDDIYVDVEFVPWRVIAVEHGCAVSLPLMNRNKAIGVTNLYFSDCSQLTPQRLRLLTTIASAATPAIENVLAKEAMQARADYFDGLDLAA